MIRIITIMAAAATLSACGNDDDPTTGPGYDSRHSAVAGGEAQPGGIAATVRMDWVYTLTHVQIINEGGIGPEPVVMAHALGAFRRGVLAEGLEAEAEAARWAALTEIRWTAEELEDGGTYDGEGGVRLTYPGCVLDSALRPALLEHYAVEGLELEAEAWAAQLADGPELCD